MAAPRSGGSAAEVVAAVWRIESARLTAALTRRTGDFALAEDLASDTFAAALQQWPRDGVPERPGAWLMATAQHRLADHARRRALGRRKHTQYVAATGDAYDPEEETLTTVASAVADDELRLLFMSCHPVLPRDSQVALTLKVVGGLQTPEIARAFLVPEATAAQRIVRAKLRLREAGVRFELPAPTDVAERLAAVLAVAYASSTRGTPRLPVSTGAGPSCAPTPSGSAAASPRYGRASRRCSACSP